MSYTVCFISGKCIKMNTVNTVKNILFYIRVFLFESFYQMFDLLSFTLSYPVRRACALFSKPACALKKA